MIPNAVKNSGTPDLETDFVTHSLHVYPAKFPAHLPRVLLKEFAKAGDKILDPFCGSGTTLVEARLSGIDCVGVDVNGLAALLSKVKATPLSAEQFGQVDLFIAEMSNVTYPWHFSGRPSIEIKEIEGVAHWFQENVAEELSFISRRIDDLPNDEVRDYLRILLSSIIVKVSNQDSDTRFAAIKKSIPNGFTIDSFLSKAEDFTNKFKESSKLLETGATLNVFNADSRKLDFIDSKSVDIIITSPPYANTYDYYLYHKFRKRWLDLDVEFAQYNEIGSRREFSSLKKPSQKWTDDLKQCFFEMNRVLKSSGNAFIVIGDSVIDKTMVKIDEVISLFSDETGFRIEKITSGDLAHKSSGFNPAFAKKGKREHLIHLQKVI